MGALWELLKCLPLLLELIKEIRGEIQKAGIEAKVKDRVNELREINKTPDRGSPEDLKRLNDNLNGR